MVSGVFDADVGGLYQIRCKVRRATDSKTSRRTKWHTNGIKRGSRANIAEGPGQIQKNNVVRDDQSALAVSLAGHNRPLVTYPHSRSAHITVSVFDMVSRGGHQIRWNISSIAVCRASRRTKQDRAGTVRAVTATVRRGVQHSLQKSTGWNGLAASITSSRG
jgi:hypothetical protein